MSRFPRRARTAAAAETGVTSSPRRVSTRRDGRSDRDREQAMVATDGAIGAVKRGLIALRDGYNRSGYRSETVGASRLIWNPRHPVHLRAYYHHAVGRSSPDSRGR
jgi:hypothetical protein